jgi:FkbM family methyltransferase
VTPAQPPQPLFDTQQPWGRFAPRRAHATLIALAHALPATLPRLARLVPALRRPVKYGVHSALDVTVWGLRLRLAPRGNIAEGKLLFAPQYFDAPEREFLARVLRPGGCFVDIGANVGAYTFWARNCVGAAGRIVAVEPDPEMRARLEFNLRSNGLDNVSVVPQALSDRQGEAVLYVNPAQRGENTIAPAQAQAAGGARVAQTVALDTLVHALQSRGVEAVDALKIDIEGHEMPVLEHFFAHAPPSLWPRALLAEHQHDAAAPLHRLLAGHGFTPAMNTRQNTGWERRP